MAEGQKGKSFLDKYPVFFKMSSHQFAEIWQHFDADGSGHIEGNELDNLFKELLQKLGSTDISPEEVNFTREAFLSTYDVTGDGKIDVYELATIIMPPDENFLFAFHRKHPLDSSVEFMRLWRKYDVDCSGYISTEELKNFLKDLMEQSQKQASDEEVEGYTITMLEIFDKNKDGNLELQEMARLLALRENFLLQLKDSAKSPEERKRDFEKVFAYYDESKTGSLEGVEVDAFVKDLMDLIKPNLTMQQIEDYKEAILKHVDKNKDNKLQKKELAMCLGVRL
ncbi:secretagogin-like [Branchiostoma floridae]|uniref:Secretagogin n=2 Tax=Branchiostoma floridae TaxID=7739 RepID=A0A9J7LB62_BRAFL|nr:secretagogin-like [Branchiostoma floridae]